MKRKRVSGNKLATIIVIVALVTVTGFLLYYLISPLSIQAPYGEPVETEYRFIVRDYATGEELDEASIYLYEADISDLDESEIADLTFADYSLAKILDSGDSYAPENNTLYYAKANLTGYVEDWIVPKLGENVIYLINFTSDIRIAGQSEGLSVNLNQTNDVNWVFNTQTFDDTGEPTSKEGFKPYYNFETDEYNKTILIFTFNTTASASFVDSADSLNPEKIIENTKVILVYDITLLGTNKFLIEFGNELGSDFEVEQVQLAIGNDAQYTVLDTFA